MSRYRCRTTATLRLPRRSRLKDPAHIKEESARNKAVRDFTTKALADLGYKSTDAQGNFIFTDIGKTMTAAAFRDGCAAKGVMVGRDFPPMEKQWARISLGTMEEMTKATEVFRSVLTDLPIGRETV